MIFVKEENFHIKRIGKLIIVTYEQPAIKPKSASQFLENKYKWFGQNEGFLEGFFNDLQDFIYIGIETLSGIVIAYLIWVYKKQKLELQKDISPPIINEINNQSIETTKKINDDNAEN